MKSPTSLTLPGSIRAVASPRPTGAVGARLRSLAGSGVAWGVATSVALSLWIVYGLDGGAYYGTPLGVRAYEPTHRLLRPSGPAGQSFGLVGTTFILVPFVYMARKRIKGLKNVGTVKGLLEVHLFCGIVGPVLVTFHTSFKFNGIVSAAYWSMVVVMLSGFAGRHLYIRIPRSIKGNELTRADLEARAVELKDEIMRTEADESVLRRIQSFEASLAPSAANASLFHLFFGELALGRKVRAFEHDLAEKGLTERLRKNLVGLAVERALALRRAEDLQRTKRLFQMWHVFHLPLVYLLLVIATAHIGLVLYMGYVPFRW